MEGEDKLRAVFSFCWSHNSSILMMKQYGNHYPETISEKSSWLTLVGCSHTVQICEGCLSFEWWQWQRKSIDAAGDGERPQALWTNSAGEWRCCSLLWGNNYKQQTSDFDKVHFYSGNINLDFRKQTPTQKALGSFYIKNFLIVNITCTRAYRCLLLYHEASALDPVAIKGDSERLLNAS